MADVPSEIIDLSKFRKTGDGPSPAEGLRLIEAFMRVKNASLRQTIIELVDKIVATQHDAN